MNEDNTGQTPARMPQISEYHILGLVAKGAMGEVYRALDPILNREVAIKVLSPRLMSDEDAVNRFQREAKATARIRHRNVAIIYGVGKTADGLPYMAMEFIDGQPLSEVIRHKTELRYSQIVDILIQCCEGLQAARREGIIHRDIKPGNIMMLADGEIKLVDFGLAKIFRDESFRTMDNMVLGTPAYMSPEQSLGQQSIDFRSDIYSLGASFYHLLTGELPFDADNPVQLMMKHVNSPLRSINVINPRVPHDLSEIIHKMMSKDREERYQDYEDLIHDLKKVKVTCLAKERNQGLAPVPSPVSAAAGAPADANGPEPTPVESSPPEPPGRTFSTLEDLMGEDPDATFRELQNTYRIPPARSKNDFEQEVENSQPGSPYLVGRHHEPGRIHRDILEAGVEDTMPRPMTWWQMSLIVVIALIVLFAVLAAVIRPPAAPDEPPAERKSLLALLIQSLAGRQRSEDKEPPEAVALREFNLTRERMTDLEIALQQYEAREGVLPGSLRELVTSGAVDENTLIDAWGSRLDYIKLDRRLESSGPDRQKNTSDDIVMKLDGSGIVMPPQFGKLQLRLKEIEEEKAQHEARGR
ncbi:MAG: hypothetical protein Kow0059_00440 [Candidatus Sumerlaeia bacterium]